MEAIARLGEPHAARRAADERDAADILEPSDSLAYGRACDAEAVGGRPEIPLFGDRQKLGIRFRSIVIVASC